MITPHLHTLPKHRAAPRLAGPGAVCARVRSERGAALVEFVLVLPWVLLLVVAIAKFGLAFNSENDETHLANEVARYATVNEDPSSKSLQEWGKSQADSKALSGQLVCISFPINETTKTSGQPGDPVEVVVKGTIHWLPILKLKAASTLIEGKAYMRLEAAPSTYTAGCA